MLDFAFAKLNLSLDVFEKQGNFHPLDSIVVSVNNFDIVTVRKSRSGVLLRGCRDIPMDQNVAYRAACEFVRRFGVGGCNIRIIKKIPVGAGMGGSSADAASVVRCLCKLYNVDILSPEVHQLCAELGSDINFMLFGGMARMAGKGDDLQFGVLAKRLYFAVTVFEEPMSTAEVYRKFDVVGGGVQGNNDSLFELLQQGNNQTALEMFSNGLQTAVKAISHYAQDYLNFCEKHGLRCCMTGSGSAYFVAFTEKNQAEYAKKLLQINGFKTFVCRSVAGSAN